MRLFRGADRQVPSSHVTAVSIHLSGRLSKRQKAVLVRKLHAVMVDTGLYGMDPFVNIEEAQEH